MSTITKPEKSEMLEPVEEFLAVSGMPQSVFGRLSVGDPNLVRRLRNNGDVGTKNASRIRRFIESYQKDKAATQ